MRPLNIKALPKRQKLVTITLVIAVIVVATAGLIFSQSRNDPKQENVNTSLEDSKEPPSSPVPPTESNPSKTACDLADSQLAEENIGTGATKDDKFPAFSTSEYRSTRCEYTNGDKTLSVILYKYSDKNKAAANKETAQRQVLVASPDGKTTTNQPRQSVAGTKDEFVVSAAILTGGTLDAEASKKLLEEVLGKL